MMRDNSFASRSRPRSVAVMGTSLNFSSDAWHTSNEELPIARDCDDSTSLQRDDSAGMLSIESQQQRDRARRRYDGGDDDDDDDGHEGRDAGASSVDGYDGCESSRDNESFDQRTQCAYDSTTSGGGNGGTSRPRSSVVALKKSDDYTSEMMMLQQQQQQQQQLHHESSDYNSSSGEQEASKRGGSRSRHGGGGGGGGLPSTTVVSRVSCGSDVSTGDPSDERELNDDTDDYEYEVEMYFDDDDDDDDYEDDDSSSSRSNDLGRVRDGSADTDDQVTPREFSDNELERDAPPHAPSEQPTHHQRHEPSSSAEEQITKLQHEQRRGAAGTRAPSTGGPLLRQRTMTMSLLTANWHTLEAQIKSGATGPTAGASSAASGSSSTSTSTTTTAASNSTTTSTTSDSAPESASSNATDPPPPPFGMRRRESGFIGINGAPTLHKSSMDDDVDDEYDVEYTTSDDEYQNFDAFSVSQHSPANSMASHSPSPIIETTTTCTTTTTSSTGDGTNSRAGTGGAADIQAALQECRDSLRSNSDVKRAAAASRASPSMTSSTSVDGLAPRSLGSHPSLSLLQRGQSSLDIHSQSPLRALVEDHRSNIQIRLVTKKDLVEDNKLRDRRQGVVQRKQQELLERLKNLSAQEAEPERPVSARSESSKPETSPLNKSQSSPSMPVEATRRRIKSRRGSEAPDEPSSALELRRAKSSSRDDQRLKRLSRKMGSIFTLSRSPLSKSSSPEFLSHDKAGLLVIKPESVESEQSEISAYRTIRFATQDLFMYHVQTTTTLRELLPQGHPFDRNLSEIFEGLATNVDDLIYTEDKEISGLSKWRMILFLTHHQLIPQHPALFVSTVLLTYRAYWTPEQLIDLLILRYNIQPPKGYMSLSMLSEWYANVQQPVQESVISVILAWIDTFFAHDMKNNSNIVNMILAFTDVCLTTQADVGAKQQIRLAIAAKLFNSPLDMNEKLHRKKPPRPYTPSKTQGLRILDIHPTELARQLTLMESTIFSAIAPSECLNQGWTKPTKHATSPNIVAMIDHFNTVCRWLAIEILAPEDVHDRAAAMHRLIVVAEECRVLQNFNAVMTILAGLQSSPVYRLKDTWALLPSKTWDLWESLSALMSVDDNYAAYRTAIREAQPPAIPYLGINLTDLVFIEDGNPSYLDDANEIANFTKMRYAASVIFAMENKKKVVYNLLPLPEIKAYIMSPLPIDDKGLMKMSLQREPRKKR